MTAWMIIFVMASGASRSIYGTEAQCQLYQKMLSEHVLFVDDIDLERQAPVAVRCERKLVGPEVEL